MRYSRARFLHCLATTILVSSLACAQSAKPRREPDVPYVPTTEPAVEAMLKLAQVKSTDPGLEKVSIDSPAELNRGPR